MTVQRFVLGLLILLTAAGLCTSLLLYGSWRDRPGLCTCLSIMVGMFAGYILGGMIT